MSEHDDERDEDGRPVAQPNAGAFLAPFQGVMPVPSSLIDQRGASVEHPSEADVERRGQVDTDPGPAGPTAAAMPGLWLPVSVSVAVWAICYSALYLVLDATGWTVGSRAPGPGVDLLGLLHEDGPRFVASVALLALALGVGAAIASPATLARWLLFIASTLGGALVVGLVVTEVGAIAALIVIVCAVVWLAASSQLRPI